MWPLDSAMGATAAHRAIKKVVDGTCTQVWAWMTECRKKMNWGVGYITIETLQKGDGLREGGPGEKERGPWDARGAGDSSPRVRGPFSLGPWAVRSYAFFPPLEQAIALSEPNFLTHSLQIHCIGPSPKTVTLQLAPSVGKLLVRQWVR